MNKLRNMSKISWGAILFGLLVFILISLEIASVPAALPIDSLGEIAAAIGIHDKDTQANQDFFMRNGSRFQESRNSVQDGDDVQYVVDKHGHQVVHAEITEPVTGSGELETAQKTLLVQAQFPYALNARLMHSLLSGSGTTAVANSLLVLHTETTTASDAFIHTELLAQYFPGQSQVSRWTGLYQSGGTAGTEAIIGYGNEEDGFFFGYDGTAFGVLHRFGGATEHQTLTVTTGAVTASGTITINLDGVGTEVEVVSGDSVQAVARAIGAVSFTEWEALVIGDTIIFTSHHAEPETGTFSLVDTDTTGVVGSFVETIVGKGPTDTWIAQTAWNHDTMDGDNDAANPSGMNLTVSNLNTFQIHFIQSGGVGFFIEDTDENALVTVHEIHYSNNNTAVSIQNPSLPMWAGVKNGSTTTDIEVSVASMAVFTEGPAPSTGLNNAAFGTSTGSHTTEQSVLCIINKPVFQSVENRVSIQPQRVSFSANGAGAAKFTTLKVHLNPTLGGDPSFTDISTATSVVASDTAGTTLTGGNITAQFEFGADVENFTLNLAEDVGPLAPETLICFGVTTDGGTTDVTVGVTWRELF